MKHRTKRKLEALLSAGIGCGIGAVCLFAFGFKDIGELANSWYWLMGGYAAGLFYRSNPE